MKLLATTPRQLLLVDVDSGTSEVLRARDGEYFGMSWDEDVIALTHSHHDCDALRTPEDYRAAVTGRIALYRPEGTVESEPALVAPHQALIVGDHVVVTNSGRNALTVFDLEGRLVAHRSYGGVEWDLTEAGRVGQHFNSLYAAGDELVAIAHDNGRKSEVWVFGWPDLEVRRVLSTETEWAHNYWKCEHGTLVCNSRFGSLVDLESGETLWRADEEPIVTRGLAATSDLLFVGRSEYGDRRQRRHNHGGVWVLDRKTLRLLDTIVLPFSGCVNDLRLVGVRDDCHHGRLLEEERLALLDAASPAEKRAHRRRAAPLRRWLEGKRHRVGPPPRLGRSARMPHPSPAPRR